MIAAEEGAGARMIFSKATRARKDAEASIICRERTTRASEVPTGTGTSSSKMILRGEMVGAGAVRMTVKARRAG